MSMLRCEPLPDAAQRFQALVAERLVQAFRWGLNDCFLFAADAVHAVTGRDRAADLRGAYGGPREAARLLERLGGLQALAADRFGVPIDPAYAVDGDIGLCPQAHGEMHLAVRNGVHWVAPTAAGLRPAAEPVMAWSLTHG